jgi:fatty-acid desaturase
MSTAMAVRPPRVPDPKPMIVPGRTVGDQVLAFSDREGDPHSPWLFRTGPVALARGFWHAHMFFWAGLVRVSFLHHVTWSINSICDMIGDRLFAGRDKAATFWPLAILSITRHETPDEELIQ